MTNNEGQQNLQKNIGFTELLIFSFSTMIGWGWVALTGDWISSGGVLGAVIAFFLGGLSCIFVGMVYSELTPMFPNAGGEIIFSYNALGYYPALFTGWVLLFAYLGIVAFEGPALITALDYLIPLPKIGYLYTVAGFDVYFSWLVMCWLAGACIIFVNFIGMMSSSLFQLAATIIMLIGGVIILALGLTRGDSENFTPLFTDLKGFASVVLAVPAMFVGFDIISKLTEETSVNIKKIPRAIILSIVLVAVWYILIIICAGVLAPVEVYKHDGISVVNIVNYATGNIRSGRTIIITAIMGILTSWNGFIIGSTRLLYSMGREEMLPKIFCRLHSKYNSTYVALLFIVVIIFIAPLLGRNSLNWFINASGFGTVIAYFMAALSFIVLRKKHQELNRSYKISHGIFWGYGALISAVLFMLIYLPVGYGSLNKTEWLIILGWLILGVILCKKTPTKK